MAVVWMPASGKSFSERCYPVPLLLRFSPTRLTLNCVCLTLMIPSCPPIRTCVEHQGEAPRMALPNKLLLARDCATTPAYPFPTNRPRRLKMAAKKKSGRPKYGKAAGKLVESAMRRKKRGTLKSGPGGKGGAVKSRKQAIAIGLSEARKKGAKVPRRKAA